MHGFRAGAHVSGEDGLAAQARAALSAQGPLAAAAPGFTARMAQQQLAAEIADAIEARDALLAEAGTGTGKTFAYLVPLLLSGCKSIISTGTKALQDQLYHRDLPRVRKALGLGLRTALLKGRANYLCLYRLQQARGDSRFLSRQQLARLQQIVVWSGGTKHGDLAELRDLPEDPGLMAQVTSTTENCLGSDCPFWDDCFVVKARQQAQSADLVVVNHHLLLADLALKQEGFGEILPGAQVFVIDEAHQLPDLAQQFFGENISARQIQELARDALAECGEVAGSIGRIQEPVRVLEHTVRELRLSLNDLPVRGSGSRLREGDVRDGVLHDLAHALADLGLALAPLVAASPGFANLDERLVTLRQRLQAWLMQPLPLTPDDEVEPDFDDPPPIPFDVLWYELSAHGFVLHRTPLDVAEPLRAFRERSGAAWILTSATLAVDAGFAHVAGRLGLGEVRTLLQASPFDWPQQALLYLPKDMPEPNSRNYVQAVVDAVRPVLQCSGGRAFLLFTSHRALREAAELLANDAWPLFVQGTAPRLELLERFRASGNGVLLGAASFWEGVDVAGDALSVVVIDRLPFAAPDDPVLEARLQAVRRSGGNPFFDEQVPQAVIALKQGVGRLIRSETDRGVLMLCDPRLLAKGYGRIFLNSLPPLPRTRSLADVEAFFAPLPHYSAASVAGES
ncbi:MAG: ATP-dependent DNA helicase [Xanthomonadaceae bacterium]|nr:ATP-dependent DNA helicase [Xanthomonadaceae bacterium]MDP2185470.1 ATP-dependent DNA helicase [Xanthomonadales bacterium]MDZ4116710.1 ATP-dependent DNA helicase [Xanthomonadaceae bacterium]MDZ4379229.1 ATP-dependent DNA helicase [Xanthomonadaceae bacterium]